MCVIKSSLVIKVGFLAWLGTETEYWTIQLCMDHPGVVC